MTLPAGSRLGSYEVLAPLGAGEMGEVYRARDRKPGLAKAAVSTREADLAHSPTAPLEHTATGMIQGTAAYMSPEQARGRGGGADE